MLKDPGDMTDDELDAELASYMTVHHSDELVPAIRLPYEKAARREALNREVARRLGVPYLPDYLVRIWNNA